MSDIPRNFQWRSTGLCEMVMGRDYAQYGPNGFDCGGPKSENRVLTSASSLDSSFRYYGPNLDIDIDNVIYLSNDKIRIESRMPYRPFPLLSKLRAALS
jgi:hypothetical protein